MMDPVLIGLDVGSTTVKIVVRAAASDEILFRDYRRHESRQAETVLRVLQQAKRELSLADGGIRLFMTGSGGQRLAELLGARFVQEVAAVGVAVENAFPEARSVIELGGQDAKMIVFQESNTPGQRKKIASMNDKSPAAPASLLKSSPPSCMCPMKSCSIKPTTARKFILSRASAASLPKPTSPACKNRACPSIN